MGVITLKLNDEVERKLRTRAAELKGAGRGALSKSVEDAIMVWLECASQPHVDRKYAAIRGERKVAEENSLRELSESLKKSGIDARDVLIQELPKIEEKRRLGLRTGSIIR